MTRRDVGLVRGAGRVSAWQGPSQWTEDLDLGRQLGNVTVLHTCHYEQCKYLVEECCYVS